MILLYRVTSFVIALLVAASFLWLTLAPTQGLTAAVIFFFFVGLLFGRLLKWEVTKASFWIFWGTPMFFLVAALFSFLFLEVDLLKILLGVGVTAGVWLYAENIFSFYHLPSTYQAYALEYLSLVLVVASGFFFASGAYGAQLFLQLPVWVTALAIFWVTLGLIVAALWVSKVSTDTIALYGFSGAIILTELYVVLAGLPTTFIANAAAFAVFLYLFVGLSRAHVLEKLSKPVLNRYIGIGAGLLALILFTARWV